MYRLKCKIRSANIFGKTLAARKFGRYDSVSYSFLRLKFSVKNAKQIILFLVECP